MSGSPWHGGVFVKLVYIIEARDSRSISAGEGQTGRCHTALTHLCYPTLPDGRFPEEVFSPGTALRPVLSPGQPRLTIAPAGMASSAHSTKRRHAAPSGARRLAPTVGACTAWSAGFGAGGVIGVRRETVSGFRRAVIHMRTARLQPTSSEESDSWYNVSTTVLASSLRARPPCRANRGIS